LPRIGAYIGDSDGGVREYVFDRRGVLHAVRDPHIRSRAGRQRNRGRSAGGGGGENLRKNQSRIRRRIGKRRFRNDIRDTGGAQLRWNHIVVNTEPTTKYGIRSERSP